MKKYYAYPRYSKRSVWGPCPEIEARAIAKEDQQRYLWAKGGHPNHSAWQKSEEFGLRFIVIESEEVEVDGKEYIQFNDLGFPALYRIPKDQFNDFLEHAYQRPRQPYPGLQIGFFIDGKYLFGPVQEDRIS